MIRLKTLKLKNFRAFETLEVNFSEGVTCVAGINGAGKSSILDAVAAALSWIIARTKTSTGKGQMLSQETDIREGASFASVETSFSFLDDDLQIRLTTAKSGYNKPEAGSDYASLEKVFKYSNEHIQEGHGAFVLPVLAYYPTNRSILDIPSRIRMKHEFDQFSVYANALNSATKFRDFFEWFRDREDIENQISAERLQVYNDHQLQAVRDSITGLLPEYANLRVVRLPRQKMTIRKNGEELDISMLSDGEKCLISLVGDIARRLSMANLDSPEPLKGDGIILIDEVELHLHPSWQRMIVPRLRSVFPNCQFIVTTHSPQVLGEIAPEDIRLLSHNHLSTVEQSLGLSSNTVLDTLMSGNSDAGLSLNAEVRKNLHEISGLIDAEKYEEAKEEVRTLEEKLHGSTPDTLELSTMITMLDGKS